MGCSGSKADSTDAGSVQVDIDAAPMKAAAPSPAAAALSPPPAAAPSPPSAPAEASPPAPTDASSPAAAPAPAEESAEAAAAAAEASEAAIAEARRTLANALPDYEQKELGKDLRDACAINNVAAVVRLLDRGADINSHGGVMYQTPLHVAAAKGSDACIEELVRRGADLHAVCEAEGSYGTPLHWAAYFGKEPTIVLLLKLGADKDAVNAKGLTPKGCAEKRGFAACAALL